jgi:hypothetical protein
MGANVEGMVSIIGGQTLVYAIAETDVLEPDLHRVSITNPPDGQRLPEYTHLRSR